MSKKSTLLSLVLLCILAPTAFAGQKMMSVQNREADLRSTPSPLGDVVTTVKLGDKVSVIEESGKWLKVTAGNGKTGWISASALSKKSVQINAGGRDADLAASSGEMAVASKGFNSQVEADFKAKNKDIDFSWVNKMEKIKITVEEIRKFLQSGGLKAGKGGA